MALNLDLFGAPSLHYKLLSANDEGTTDGCS
jgi:hypothetical protein